MSDFVTLQDVLTLTGKTYTTAEQNRITAVIPHVCNALRYEATKVGKDIDSMMTADTTGAYQSVVKLVTVDVLTRVMRQSLSGEPMSQESQGGLGYTWSGTFAVPGGGIAAAIMKNDLKRLGLRTQRISTIEMWSAPNRGDCT